MNVKTNLLFTCFIFTSFNVFAQLTTENLPTAAQYKNIKKQEVRLTLHSKAKITGILYQITEEAIILLPKDDSINNHAHFIKLVKEDQKIINKAFIFMVKTKKRNAGKGFLLGLGIGAVMGYAIGGASTGYEFAVVGVGGIGGGLLGLIIGSMTSKSYNPKNKTAMEQLRKKGIMYGY